MIMAVKTKCFRAVLLSSTLCTGLLFNSCGSRQPEQPATRTVSTSTAAPQKVSPADTRPVVVAFGDSLTAGYGVEPGKSYPDFLQHRLDAAGYKYHVVNLGVSGDTTTDGVQRLPDVIAARPVLVILEFGGNDGLRGLPVSTTRANLTQMIQTLQKAGVRILLAGMTLPRNYGQAYIYSFEQVFVSLARQFHLPSIPFLLEGVGGHPDLTQSDGIHPTTQGCEIVSGNVMKYLAPLLKK